MVGLDISIHGCLVELSWPFFLWLHQHLAALPPLSEFWQHKAETLSHSCQQSRVCVHTLSTLLIAGRFPGNGSCHGLLSSPSGVVSFLSKPLNTCWSGCEATRSDFAEDAAHTPVTHPKIVTVEEEHRYSEMLHRCNRLSGDLGDLWCTTAVHHLSPVAQRSSSLHKRSRTLIESCHNIGFACLRWCIVDDPIVVTSKSGSEWSYVVAGHLHLSKMVKRGFCQEHRCTYRGSYVLRLNLNQQHWQPALSEAFQAEITSFFSSFLFNWPLFDNSALRFFLFSPSLSLGLLVFLCLMKGPHSFFVGFGVTFQNSFHGLGLSERWDHQRWGLPRLLACDLVSWSIKSSPSFSLFVVSPAVDPDEEGLIWSALVLMRRPECQKRRLCWHLRPWEETGPPLA